MPAPENGHRSSRSDNVKCHVPERFHTVWSVFKTALGAGIRPSKGTVAKTAGTTGYGVTPDGLEPHKLWFLEFLQQSRGRLIPPADMTGLGSRVGFATLIDAFKTRYRGAMCITRPSTAARQAEPAVLAGAGGKSHFGVGLAATIWES